MNTYKFGDIVITRVPFSDGHTIKIAPAIVIHKHQSKEDDEEDYLLARITTQERNDEFDFRISNWAVYGLKLPSTIRINKLFTLKSEVIEKKIGELNLPDKDNFRNKVSDFFKFIELNSE